MFIDKIQRIFGTNRIQSLLLEVFAIFLGITASFAVEEWREERQDRQNYERYLQAIYFDALRENATARRFLVQGNQTVMALHTLQTEETDSLSDGELLTLTGLVFGTWSFPRGDSSYRALQSAGVSAPFDDTMQVLNSSYELNSDARHQLDELIADRNRLIDSLRSNYGTISNPGFAVRREDRSVGQGTRFDQPAYRAIRGLFYEGGEFLPQREGVRRLREAFREPEIDQLLTAEIEHVMQAMDQAINLADANYSILQAIREELPDLRLAVRSLALVGDATPTGWTEISGLSLQREFEGSDWWSAEVELRDGTLKLVANGVWGTSWGAPITFDRADPMEDDRVYLGDPAEVFPSGTAEFDGLNIPVKGGRYEVRFNIHTFEYEFAAIGD